jgi:hypothetical protein
LRAKRAANHQHGQCCRFRHRRFFELNVIKADIVAVPAQAGGINDDIELRAKQAGGEIEKDRTRVTAVPEFQL